MPVSEAEMKELAAIVDSINKPEELSSLLEGLTDADIRDIIELVGVERALTRVFEVMVEHFLPEKAARYGGTIEWNIQTSQGKRVYHLKIEGGKCSYAEGPASYPRVKLTATLPVFLRLLSGRVSGLQTYADGDLGVSGDMILAQMQQTFFDADLSNAELRISTPSELLRVIKDRTDQEIEAGLVVTGAEKALDKVFEGMVEHFLPAKAGKKQAVIEWHIMTPLGEKTYQFTVDRGRCSYRRGASAKPNVTLSVNLPVFLRVACGQLNGLIALAKGQLKVRGNILLARSQQDWFDLTR